MMRKQSMPDSPPDRLRWYNILVPILRRLYMIPRIIGSRRVLMACEKNRLWSFGALAAKTASRFPDAAAIKDETGVISYRELDARANRYVQVFLRHGIGKGTVVFVVLGNRADLLIVYTALARIGAISALVNPQLPAEALLRYREACGATALVLGEETLPAPGAAALAAVSGLFGPRFFIRLTEAQAMPQGMEDLCRSAGAMPENAPMAQNDVRPSDCIALLFTSGTDGRAKAARITHGRVLAGAHWFGKTVLRLTQRDTLYSPLPLFHVLSLVVGWSSVVATGAAIALRDQFSVSRFAEDLEKFRATAILYVGEILTYLSKTPGALRSNAQLRAALGNGMRPALWSRVRHELGVQNVYEIYGATESAWVFTNLLNLDCTVGCSLNTFAIVEYDAGLMQLVRDGSGRLKRLVPGKCGLLIFKVTKQSGFTGYTSADETEKKILRNCFKPGDAWFNTGDIMQNLGFRHARFIDRAGDTFRWKGENVSTLEVEEALEAFPAVAEAIVFGVKVDGCDGRAGMAALLPKEPEKLLDLDSLACFCMKKLPEYALPRYVRIIKSLEHTETFKKSKGIVRQEGYDREKVSDPLFVWDEQARRYSIIP